MTPERLKYLINHCLGHRKLRDERAHQADIARFFHVRPLTLHRWLTGEARIPRSVAIVMEIFHADPEWTAERVERTFRERDQAEVTKR